VLFHRSRSRLVERPPEVTDREARIFSLGSEILSEARRRRGGVFSSKFWSDQLMSWTMKDPAFKTQLFRFVDVFPALRGDAQVHEHLRQYLQTDGVTLPPLMKAAMGAGAIFKGALAGAVTGRIEQMARQFIAGRTLDDALPVLKGLQEKGVAASVDLLGEACLSDAEAKVYQQRYLELVSQIRGALGVERANVSVKISSLSARIRPEDPKRSIESLIEMLAPILQAAGRESVLINFDMEQHVYKDLTIDLLQECVRRFDYPAGIAIQAYLRSAEADAERVVRIAEEAGRPIAVRLIKGAYWDYEVATAERLGWPVPVWMHKHETDASFERTAELLLDAHPHIALAVGSHNLRSIVAALVMAEERSLPAVEVQMLFGMADELRDALVARGVPVRQYVPIGEMIPGMAYLVRRLLENTSNESWLRASAESDASPEELLRPPQMAAAVSQDEPRASGDFANEPPRDFSRADVRSAFGAAVAEAVVPEVRNDSTIDDVNAAVARACEAFPTWRDAHPDERASLLRRAADAMAARRDELAGIVIRESGKNWIEADADVCEAIDFLRFYAAHAPALFRRSRVGPPLAAELNEQLHQPRGVAAVISPWNFPLAICAGMTSAALATGNCAIVKPAEQTPGIARAWCEILWNVGVPRDVLQLLPGAGETVGAALVRHPGVALIAFTGSMQVGLDILQAAARTGPEQGFVKKVVCEMGGKNAIIVDSSADLDEAVLGVRQSAFGYAGQKCSACSRLIVLEDVYDAMLLRLIEATRSMRIGDPIEPGTDIGPLIDAEAAEKVRRYIEIGKTEATLALAIDAPAGLEHVGKPFIGPHIFTDVRMEHRIAREEIFGPVLAVLRAKDFDEALQLANAAPMKLTGGLFSRTPEHLERARRQFRVGNLYLNRGITGAIVGRQPFGGFGLSGTGTQAGGKEYLLHFVEPRTIIENTMRRGFTPEESVVRGQASGATDQGRLTTD
jgi:RHH-type proline utilization regulon transcriptional repressor/proline dehydrogenase/delta 1-pyrroline-5-carboxylate dehydrogenase